MVASESFAEFLREQLAPLGGITMRRIFGKTGVFCDGVMTENTRYLRVDGENKEAFTAAIRTFADQSGRLSRPIGPASSKL